MDASGGIARGVAPEALGCATATARVRASTADAEVEVDADGDADGDAEAGAVPEEFAVGGALVTEAGMMAVVAVCRHAASAASGRTNATRDQNVIFVALMVITDK
jgi:hypothetical protein